MDAEGGGEDTRKREREYTMTNTDKILLQLTRFIAAGLAMYLNDESSGEQIRKTMKELESELD